MCTQSYCGQKCAQKFIVDKNVHTKLLRTKVCTKIYSGQKCAHKSIVDKSVHKIKI